VRTSGGGALAPTPLIKLHNNQSIVIAGFNNEEISRIHKEIPLLSSLPYVGKVFKWDSNSKNKETFAIIVSNIDAANDFAKKGGTPLKRGKYRANEVSLLTY
jgi:hypothetical protein